MSILKFLHLFSRKDSQCILIHVSKMSSRDGSRNSALLSILWQFFKENETCLVEIHIVLNIVSIAKDEDENMGHRQGKILYWQKSCFEKNAFEV